MDISIIIPCYNHGLYIQEAIDSILACKNVAYEIIIINDGSTDTYTIQKLNELKESGYIVLSHSNQGPAYSRNVGISVAKGKYILALDADNKIKPAYIDKALKALIEEQCDIVYANPIYIGEETPQRKFKVQAFDGLDLFFKNSIDTCAIYKKTVWVTLGGYDDQLPFHGQEDWEFWLHAFIKEFKFKHLNEGLYYYRILNNSLIARTVQSDKEELNHDYLLKKHFSVFKKLMAENYSYGKMYQHDIQNPLRASLKYLYRFLVNKKNRV